MPKKLTTVEFISRSKAVHANRYDYKNTKYIDWKTPVKILCPVHGVFNSIPNNHLRGTGCPLCGGTRSSTHTFVTKAKAVHGNKYTYASVVYLDKSTKVTITCARHGDFSQTPRKHLIGQGCPTCAQHAKLRTHRTIKRGSKSFLVQGYEPFAIDWLLETQGLRPSDILCGDKVPVIQYNWNGRNRRHYPDLYVPKLNRLLEVKSLWTLGLTNHAKGKKVRSQMRAKRLAAKSAGFIYSVLLFDNVGTKLCLREVSPNYWKPEPKLRAMLEMRLALATA